MNEYKPRIRCTNPPQMQCGWCRQWDAIDNLRCSPAGIGKVSAVWGTVDPMHYECFVDWYDGDRHLKHPDVQVET
jgi:hypothetical protein